MGENNACALTEREVKGEGPVTLADGRSTSKPMCPAPGAGKPAVQGSTATHQEPEPTEMCPTSREHNGRIQSLRCAISWHGIAH